MPIFLVYVSFLMTFLTRSCGETIKYYLTQSINFSNLNFSGVFRTQQSRKCEFTEFVLAVGVTGFYGCNIMGGP